MALTLGCSCVTGGGAALDGRGSGAGPRPGHGLRQPGAPGLRRRRWWAPSELRNAVSLNSVLVNIARAVGPAVAGAAHRRDRHRHLLPDQRRQLRRGARGPRRRWTVAALRPSPPAPSAQPARCARACAYVAGTPELLVPLIMLALVGTLAYEFQVVLPLLARGPFDGGAGDLRPAHLRDGRGRDRRRPGGGRPRPHRPAPADRRRRRLRRRHARPPPRADAAGRARRPGGWSAPRASRSSPPATPPCSSPATRASAGA